MRVADAVPAAVPQEWRYVTVRGGQDLADKQHVIARGVQRVMPAFEPRRAAFDQRRAGVAKAKRHAGEAIGMRTGEAPRQVDLVVREHVDGVILCSLECVEAARAQSKAPDDERRIERYRVERIGG